MNANIKNFLCMICNIFLQNNIDQSKEMKFQNKTVSIRWGLWFRLNHGHRFHVLGNPRPILDRDDNDHRQRQTTDQKRNSHDPL